MPSVLGIDEHSFSKRHGYATTFCDLRKNKIFDVAKGRSSRTNPDNLSLDKLKKRHVLLLQQQPAITTIYQFKRQLHRLLMKKMMTAKGCQKITPLFKND